MKTFDRHQDEHVLNNAVVLMVSTHPSFATSSNSFNNPLLTGLKASITIGHLYVPLLLLLLLLLLFTLLQFFTSLLADGFPLEFELLYFDLLTRPKMPFKVMHRKEVTHSNGS